MIGFAHVDVPALISGSAAGDTYKRLADVQIRLDSKHEAATAYVEAAKAFLKVDHKGTRGDDGEDVITMLMVPHHININTHSGNCSVASGSAVVHRHGTLDYGSKAAAGTYFLGCM